MPEVTGNDALKEIIKFDGNSKVVMCSAIGQKTTIIEALTAGAKDFIVKLNFNKLNKILLNLDFSV